MTQYEHLMRAILYWQRAIEKHGPIPGYMASLASSYARKRLME